MTLEELWQLHEKVLSVLDARVEQERCDIERRIELLAQRISGGRRKRRPRVRRSYPKVLPRFRNPHDPSVTWSGRGKRPRWITELLAKGEDLEKIRI